MSNTLYRNRGDGKLYTIMAVKPLDGEPTYYEAFGFHHDSVPFPHNPEEEKTVVKPADIGSRFVPVAEIERI